MFSSTQKKIWFGVYTTIMVVILHYLTILSTVPFATFAFREEYIGDFLLQCVFVLGFISMTIVVGILLGTMTLFVKKPYRKKLMWIALCTYIIIGIVEIPIFPNNFLPYWFEGIMLFGYHFFGGGMLLSSNFTFLQEIVIFTTAQSLFVILFTYLFVHFFSKER